MIASVARGEQLTARKSTQSSAARDRGDRFQTQLLRECRAVRALVDMAVFGESHHKNIAETFSFLQMADVSDMKQVKNTVALHDLFALLLQPRDLFGKFLEAENFRFPGLLKC